MNRYVATFPHMHYPEERELRGQLAEENLADLEKIAKLWKLGEEWVQVIGVAQNLYDRLMSNCAEKISRCRCEYPELEKSVYFAPIGGLYSDKRDKRDDAGRRPGTRLQALEASLVPLCACSLTKGETEQLQDQRREQQQQQSDHQPALDPLVWQDSGITGDDWRLWSFWDDPHLLSWDPSALGL